MQDRQLEKFNEKFYMTEGIDGEIYFVHKQTQKRYANTPEFLSKYGLALDVQLKGIKVAQAEQEIKERKIRQTLAAKAQRQKNREGVTTKPFVFAILGTADDYDSMRPAIPDLRFCSELKPETLARLVMLSTYVRRTNKLDWAPVVRSNQMDLKNEDYMQRGEIKRVVKLEKSHIFSDFIREIESAGYLKIVDSIYYVSPKLHCGKLPPRYSWIVNKIHSEQIRALYAVCKPSDHKKIGMILQLLPYLHRDKNILCKNPTEQWSDKIIPLTAKEIVEILGKSVAHTYRTKKTLFTDLMRLHAKIDGKDQYFAGRWTTGDGDMYVVNPNFIFCGTKGQKGELLKGEWMFSNKWGAVQNCGVFFAIVS